MIKSLICGTFVLLLVIAGPAWSEDPPGKDLKITEVLVDDQNNPTSIMIIGKGFLFGSPLDVTLGEFGSLTITDFEAPTDILIVATLPDGILPGD